MALFTDDDEVREPGVDLRGKNAIREFVAREAPKYEDYVMEELNVFQKDDQIAIEWRNRFKYERRNNDVLGVTVIRVRDGKIRRMNTLAHPNACMNRAISRRSLLVALLAFLHRTKARTTTSRSPSGFLPPPHSLAQSRGSRYMRLLLQLQQPCDGKCYILCTGEFCFPVSPFLDYSGSASNALPTATMSAFPSAIRASASLGSMIPAAHIAGTSLMCFLRFSDNSDKV